MDCFHIVPSYFMHSSYSSLELGNKYVWDQILYNTDSNNVDKRRKRSCGGLHVPLR